METWIVVLGVVLVVAAFAAGCSAGKEALKKAQVRERQQCDAENAERAERNRQADVESLARQAVVRLTLHEQRDRALTTRQTKTYPLGPNGPALPGPWELDPTWAPPSASCGVGAQPKPKRKSRAKGGR